MSLIPSCQEVQASLTEYMEGTLPLLTRIRIRLHLSLCRACEDLWKAIKALPAFGRKLLAAPGQPAPEAERAFEGALKRIKTPGGPK